MSAAATAPTSALATVAEAVEWSGGLDLAAALTNAADARTRHLVEGFVHQAGPPPARFAWVALGSHARGELHFASDQDHALIWQTEHAAASGYARDLAGTVIAGLVEFGMRPCDGGYMADRWSMGMTDWVEAARDRIAAPTAAAVVETDVFLDVRGLSGDLDLGPVTDIALAGADSSRLLHGLADAANSFRPPRRARSRHPHGLVDLKRAGLTPIVLLARLYCLRARSLQLGTVARLQAAAAAGQLSEELAGRLVAGFESLVRLRLTNQLAQAQAGLPFSDKVLAEDLPSGDAKLLRRALRSVRAAQSVTAVTFRTDL